MANIRPSRDRRRPPGSSGASGLALLDDVQRLFVKQHVEMFEAMTGWETANSYTVLDQRGDPLYNVREESSACMRQCCKSNRSFVLHIQDLDNHPVLVVERPYRFYWQEILVRDPGSGSVLGTVTRSFAILSRTFEVRDRDGAHLFNISSPLFSPWTFYLTDPRTQAQLGMVQKKWSGLAQELFTDADNFGIEFPSSLPRSSKSLLLAAVFLIDFMYFEDNDMNSQRGRGRRGGGMGFRTNMF
eukprot:g1641.t1